MDIADAWASGTPAHSSTPARWSFAGGSGAAQKRPSPWATGPVAAGGGHAPKLARVQQPGGQAPAATVIDIEAPTTPDLARGDGSFSWIADLTAWVDHVAGGSPASPTEDGEHHLPTAPAAAAGATSTSRGDEERVVAEVRRIRGVGSSNYRRLFELQPSESFDLQVVQTRYRQLMRLLHPDKRSALGEAQAGGREVCDEAIRLAQRALETARQELGGYEADPTRRAQESMRRMQEVQRQQARQALVRQQQAEVGELSCEIDKVLARQLGAAAAGPAGSPLGGAAPSPPPSCSAGAARPAATDATSQQIADLLARMAPSHPVAPPAPPPPTAPRPAAFPHSMSATLRPAWHSSGRHHMA